MGPKNWKAARVQPDCRFEIENVKLGKSRDNEVEHESKKIGKKCRCNVHKKQGPRHNKGYTHVRSKLQNGGGQVTSIHAGK